MDTFLGESLPLNPERGNSHDRLAVSVVKDEHVVSQAPCEISQIFSYFMQQNGTVSAEVTGHRRYGRGLEVPCVCTLTAAQAHKKGQEIAAAKIVKLNSTQAQHLLLFITNCNVSEHDRYTILLCIIKNKR